MKKILIAFLAISGSLLLALSDISCSSHLNWLLEHRWVNDLYNDHLKFFFETKSFWIGLLCNALAVLIEIFAPSSPKPILKSYMNQVYDNLFNGAADEVRITVFRITKGYRLWPSFIWKNLCNIFKHFKKSTICYQIKSFPWLPWKKYVAIYVRCGNPHSNGTMTIFKYPLDRDEVNGIASHVLMTQQKFSTSLPNIKNISIERYKKIEGIPHGRRQNVQTYMDKSFLKSFDQLKSIHSRATQIWAMPIVGEDNIWGVLVVDSLKNSNPFNNSHIDQSLELATNTIYTILRGI